MKIIGHRGASEACPENTMAAFQMAIDLDADGFECDVQELGDGNLIVLHDANLWRTSGAQWFWWLYMPLRSFRMSRRTRLLQYQDIKDVDIGSWFEKRFCNERIPSLAAVAAFAKETKSHCFAELKTFGGEDFSAKAVEIVRETPPQLLSWISFDFDLLLRIKQLDPLRKALHVVNLTSFETAMKAAEKAARAGLDGLDLHADASVVTTALVDYLHDRNMLVAVWVKAAPAANDTRAMRHHMKAVGVDFFTSNLPPPLEEEDLELKKNCDIDSTSC